MSWKSCMTKKVQDKYGSRAAECVAEEYRKVLRDLAHCIAVAVPGSDQDKIFGELVEWSLACDFEAGSPEPAPPQS